MKTFLTAILLFLGSYLFSQSVMSPLLFSKLSEENKDEIYMNINVFFNSSYDIYKIADDLNKIKASFSERNFEVIKFLRMNSELSQEYILPVLEEFLISDKDAIRYVKFYWAVNMMNIEIKKSLIYSLSESQTIKYIDINSPRYRFIDAEKSDTIAQKIVNGAEPGLKTINAHKLWEMGYTGRNILFLSMDTGVFPEHPAISDNFAGNYLPLSQCWYGVRNEEPTDHASSSHGTHTTGTVLGLDQANNDTIGVAFNAMWIASDPVASSDDDLLAPADFMSVFEWVLDPDGNPETSDDVPRVINNSWGYDYSMAMEFGACEMPEAEILVTIETAGICSPFSAGNDGPDATTTGFPAMRVFNDVNPMAVGALTGSNQVASFSSRGPTPCISEEGPLQIKPEVSAPGVNIRSCSGIDSYAYLQGTSMACPHVSGALLLLSEAFPMASAYELKYALYVTAVDLGDTGEDNSYGRGLIDVFAAFEYLSLSYTPVPPVTEEYDLKISLLNPAEYFICKENSILPIQVNIENVGQNPIDTFIVKIFINELMVCDSTIDVMLQSEDEFLFETENFELPAGKNYVHAIVNPKNDYNEYDRFNNATNKKINVLGESEFPFTEDFELISDNLSNSDLYILNPDHKNTWTNLSWGTDDQYKAMGVNFNTYGSRLWEEDNAMLPQISLPDDDSIQLSFTYAYKKRLVNIYNDSLLVEISTDCGLNFDEVLFSDGGQTLATVPEDAMSNIYKPIDVSEFDTVTLSLDNYRGQDVVIRFKTKNDRGSVIYIDKIDLSYLSADNIENDVCVVKKALIFPNPAQDYIIIDCMSENEQIVLFDVSGKSVLIKDISKGKNFIDVSDIVPGIYTLNFLNSFQNAKIVICD
ncbi:MAG TPA: S8 family serine peptidase [Bacteroidales bacterium]|nr:S8 family serine peptidase [Bacteroidales bacterium]